MARSYAVCVGAVLLLVGLLGFLTKDSAGLIRFHPAHNIFLIASGLIGLWSGIRGKKLPLAYSQMFGIVFTVVAILGFSNPGGLGGRLGLDLTYNLVYLIIGLTGLYLGFALSKHELSAAHKSGV